MTAARALMVLLAALLAQAAAAEGIEARRFASGQEEARYQRLIGGLRCMVCQNQTLADSNADLAKDMRDAVLGQMRAGKKDGEIVAFMTARYGDFVLYKPPLNWQTAALWGAPFVLALALLAATPAFLRRRRRAALSPTARERAKRLLAEEPE